MDFNDTPELASFRNEIREWLAANARTELPEGVKYGGEAIYAVAKEWYKKTAEAGYACLDWPKEYGGAGLTPLHKVVWAQEVANYAEPDSYFVIGIGNCGPAVTHFSDEKLKQRLLPRMASADDVWCQLFSEPSAGSDLAGLRTQAVQQDDGSWRINGQKIWTSGANHSDYGVVLCRTDTSVSKYKGLTMFILDMKQPGVTVKPIKQMDGNQHFNEVFFSDAEIPDAYRLGEVNQGWGAALLVLMNERMAITAVAPDGFDRFLEFVKSAEIAGQLLCDDPQVRDRLAHWYSQHAGVDASYMRMLTAVSKGGMPGAEGAVGKLIGGRMNQDIANFTLSLMGEAGAVHDAATAMEQAYFQDAALFSPGIRLAGGTDEIMRNIIAEQILGLPQEPRADKGVAFKDIPSGNG
ncbi:MAG: acyl-CoA dehydrogenase family protein [Gammaproteobacteria bacterium]|nr:acyl-CoA dehydrogenase family protein [Gammaproteobacteria bacterium]NND38945.1 acyl-CoA dehydrogenase [Pseudomonadales bacterium]